MYHAPSALSVVEGSGYYLDSGGYAWQWDRATGRLFVVAAPGGGMKWVYAASHPKFRAIYAKVIAGKTPWTTDLANILAIAGAQGGSATGTAATGTAARPATVISQAAAPPPTVAPAEPIAMVPIYQRAWFPFAAAGAALALLGLVAVSLGGREK